MNRDTRSLLGTSIINGAGSLPLHLSPLIIAVLMADGTGTMEAGGSRAMVLIGQLTTATGLPLLTGKQIGRGHTAIAAIVMITGLAISGSWLLTGWFLIGLSCGVLGYLATLTAAVNSNPSHAFLVRLGVTLCIAGTVAAAFNLMPLSSYTMLVFTLSGALIFLLTVGMGLQLPLEIPKPKPRTRQESRRVYFVLGLLFLLFVGQNGQLAYVLRQAGERGISLGQAVWALALIKVLAGVILLALRNRRLSLWLLATGGAAANVTVATTTSVPVFVVGLLGLDLIFCLMAPKLQAMAAELAPVFTGKWSLPILLLGGAAGTMLHGLMIEHGQPFLYVAVLTAVLPITLILERTYENRRSVRQSGT